MRYAALFHGDAYGEAVLSAEITPLFSYLIGFAGIQLALGLFAWKFGSLWLKDTAIQGWLRLRFIGFSVCGLGAAFLSGVVLG
ncbi:MAG: HupE/UreJ family protein [Cyanobacteria bacterium P01_A01_bin.116]